jgi:cytoskeletal protein RodZ
MMFPLSRADTVGEFGDKFRKAREKKDLSLDDVSNVTKIGSRMLQAIEEEHFDQLPGGVFNKGFIRAYAKHLGLNSEDAVTDYLACLRQAQIDAHEVWEPERPRPPRPAPPEKRPLVAAHLTAPKPRAHEEKEPKEKQVEELSERQLPRAEDVRLRQSNFAENSLHEIPWRIVAIAALVIVLGILFWTRRSHNTTTAAASASNTEQPKNAPSPAPVSAPQNQSSKAAISNGATTAARPSTHTSQPPTHPAPAPAKPPAAAATSGAASTAPADAAGGAGNDQNDDKSSDEKNNNDKSDVTVRTFPKSTPKASPSAAPTFTLVIRATETSSISVLADGQPVSHETLIAPAHTSVRATREIVARVGNAAGVTFLWNGQEIPADGAESEVKTFVFDSHGMRVIPSTPPTPQNH